MLYHKPNQPDNGTDSEHLRNPQDVAPSRRVDIQEAKRFLEALEVDQDTFLFTSLDDNKDRRLLWRDCRLRVLKAEKEIERLKKSTGDNSKAIGELNAEIAAIRRDMPAGPQTKLGSADSLLRWMQGRQAAGYSVTVCVASMAGNRRLSGDVRYFRAVFAEMDSKQLKEWPIPPSIVVETSPGRYHVYWLLEFDKAWTAELWDGVQKRLVFDYGADNAAKDAARTLRLPGSWNLKTGRAPHFVNIVSAEGYRYSVEEITAAFPPVVMAKQDDKPKPDWRRFRPQGDDLERFRAPLSEIPADEYSDWLRVGMALHKESGGSASGLAMWDAWSARAGNYTDGECEYRWGSFKSTGACDGGAIFGMASDCGWVKPVKTERQRPKTAAKANPAPVKRGKPKASAPQEIEPDDDLECGETAEDEAVSLMDVKDLPELIARLVCMPDVEWLPQGGELCDGRGITKAELKRLVRDARKEASERARQRARDAYKQERERRRAATEELPLSRNDPNMSADLFKQEHHPRLVYLQQEFLSWDGAAYVVVDPEYLKTQVRSFLRSAVAEDEYGNQAPFCPKADDVSQVIAALADGSGLDSANVKTPSWLKPRGINPLGVISFRNGWLDTATGAFNKPDPNLLTRNALAFGFDPRAPEPGRFHGFLKEIWPTEEEREEFIPQLQRVMGLLLIPDTSFQKIFLFLGIPRSGKGTLLRLINQLVGEVNSGSTSARSLAKGEFTLDSFRGKTLVAIPDMRVHRDLADDLTEKLLNISGEDKVSINRKNKSILHETLSCRLLIASNDIPSFPDDSGALSKRYIPFRFKTTFEGKEDGDLGAKLEAELPGIANWALAGLTAIRREKRFFLGPLAKAELKIAYAQGAPLAEFAEDRIEVKAGASVVKDQLYSAYTLWCMSAGTAKPLGQALFHKKLRSMIPTINESRPRDANGTPVRTITGISLIATNF
jgi:P4 family phage/plasmid primase-like protien